MLKNIASRARGVIGFLRGNARYIGVLFLFLLVTFYSLVIVKDAEKKKQAAETAKKTDTEQSARAWDLDRIATWKAYPGIFSSRSGDVYRIVVRVEASDAANIRVSARALDGKILPIALFDVPKGEPVFREAVFLADGEYEDVLVGLENDRHESGGQWDDTRVLIDRVSITRLAVSSLAEAKRLAPTLFGEPDRSIEYLPAHQSAMEDDSFGKGKNVIGQYFGPTDTELVGLRFPGMIVGNGGTGSYAAELRECADDACGSSGMKMVASVDFHVKNMDRYRQVGSDDVYEIPIVASLDPKKRYFIGLNGAKAGTDAGNYLLLRKFGGGEAPLGSFFGAVFLQKSSLLSSAKIEDVGNGYRYEYRMKNLASDISDVYASFGRLKFDKSLAGLAMPQEKDASMTFRVDTLHPIVSMRMSASGIDTKSAQFVMEYSFDEKEWIDIPSVQQESAPQIFDMSLPASGKSVVYVRARSVQDGSKFKDWGIRDLAISAVLKKE